MQVWKVAACLVLIMSDRFVLADDEFEKPPIEYSASVPDNRISQFQAALDRHDLELRYEPKSGYLPDLLDKLDVLPESQLLVFSKTSLQRDQIKPRTPRAIYFNDDVYLGYCHDGEVIELSVADPRLGAVFYTLEQSRRKQPALTRQTDRCLQCHGTSQTDNLPGHLVRSVFTDPRGLPILSEGSHRVDQTTPIENRWGGWYVSGTHGDQPHLGNLIVRREDAASARANLDGLNVTDLRDRFSADDYLSPHSDLVALMVFEHQTYVHNLLTRASYTTRQALHYEAEMNKALGEPEGQRLESTTRRIKNAGEKLVEGLLFVGEAPIKQPISGTSGFADKFASAGRRDRQGRSLRDFDLQTRLFKYPCSYLIESQAFRELPPAMKSYVTGRLREILDGHGGAKYEYLSESDRPAISQILDETLPDLWRTKPAG